MNLTLTDLEAEAILRTIDAGLKNTHIGGLQVMEGANIFIRKINLARQQEQNEKTTPLAAVPDSGAAGQG